MNTCPLTPLLLSALHDNIQLKRKMEKRDEQITFLLQGTAKRDEEIDRLQSLLLLQTFVLLEEKLKK